MFSKTSRGPEKNTWYKIVEERSWNSMTKHNLAEWLKEHNLCYISESYYPKIDGEEFL